MIVLDYVPAIVACIALYLAYCNIKHLWRLAFIVASFGMFMLFWPQVKQLIHPTFEPFTVAQDDLDRMP